MGKKDKRKNKISGTEKTAKKTEKKLSAKQKKELAARGEEDIEKVIAEIEKEEAKRQKVLEHVLPIPSRRVNCTLSPHPLKDEIIMYGGEFHDGQKTYVYGDLFFYNINKNEWTLVKAPGAPPPRCGHQAVTLSSNKGELWVFGGEFSSPSESQFYHYRDLWVFHLGDKKWEKISAPGGPSARSGHRMVAIKKNLYIFGGFHDNLRDYKYFNDIHSFNTSTYTWDKIEVLGIPPPPRSGCIIFPTPENKIIVWGGYSKEKLKKDVDKGHVHMDMFLLSSEKNDHTGLKWKWSTIKHGGITISPRCSTSAVLIQPYLAYIFGGVYDEDDDEEELKGNFYNDLFAFNINKLQWQSVTLSGKKDGYTQKRRRKLKEGGDSNNGEEEEEEEEEVEEPMDTTPASTVITDDDGIFTVTMGPTQTQKPMNINCNSMVEDIFVPTPRINAGLVIKHNILYMYGGMFEDGDKQYTLCDFYKLDCKKLDEWVIIHKDDLSSQIWLNSSSDSESESSDDSESDRESGSDNGMDVENKS